jgi:hypothetical protein
MKRSLPDLLIKDEYYWVPCIPIPDKLVPFYLNLEDGWLPVLGQPHIDGETISEDDAENVYALHHHVDVRFINVDLPIGGSIGVPVNLFAHLLDLWDLDAPDDEKRDLVEWKSKKCYRVATDDFQNSGVPNIYEPGVISKGLKLRDQKVCPHQKACLNGVPKMNNSIVCPVHGLKWNTLSGELIPRKNYEGIIYGIAMTEENKDAYEFLDPDYFIRQHENNIRVEVWSRFPMPIFAYFDRSTFEADQVKYL